MEVIFDRKRTIERAHEVVSGLSPEVSLDDIVFVGAELGDTAITTLPSTFPDGDLRYEVYQVTQMEKRQGKSVSEISRAHDFPFFMVDNAYKGHPPHAVKAVQSAENKGILPYSYENNHIDLFNKLFSLAFWTGSIQKGNLVVVPNLTNITALEGILASLGYCTPEKERDRAGQGKTYYVHGANHVINSWALARTFGLLGLPFEEGHKSRIEDFDVPWYARFMRGEYFMKGQSFSESSKGKAEKFITDFVMALLSDKTSDIPSWKNSFAIRLPGTYSKSCGERFAQYTAQMLMDWLPELNISENHLKTYHIKDKNAWTNGVRIGGRNSAMLLDYLKNITHHQPDQENPAYLQVRELASHFSALF